MSGYYFTTNFTTFDLLVMNTDDIRRNIKVLGFVENEGVGNR